MTSHTSKKSRLVGDHLLGG
ncbi:unnamed protein product [Spirodela intermedia]|uniref:Uncharacterized protein n=1 Tax=Spirodela intermedia TaxID=51605 RepID=A0A7I8INB0_SPIIN|nr:unnamed protein product [Spirodela intermedia]CAA6659298.1 unnamed protein product [Spirodela intermedia]